MAEAVRWAVELGYISRERRRGRTLMKEHLPAGLSQLPERCAIGVPFKFTCAVDVRGSVGEQSKAFSQRLQLKVLRPYSMRLEMLRELGEYLNFRVDSPRAAELAKSRMKELIQPRTVAMHPKLM